MLSDEIRLQIKVEIEKKKTAESELINSQQEIEKITDELVSGEQESGSTMESSGDKQRKENLIENERNLPELIAGLRNRSIFI